MREKTVRSVGRPADLEKDREILAAGRALLFGQGPEAVTMEAVARTAGVAKPTLYRRYANRDALIAAVVGEEAEHMAGRFGLEPGSTVDLEHALVAFGCDLSSFLLGAEHLRFMHAMGASVDMAQSTREAIYRHGPQDTRRRLASWLTRAHERGLLHCPDADYAAEQFLGMIMGLDLVRSLYRVRRLHDTRALRRRIDRVVTDFLRLYEA